MSPNLTIRKRLSRALPGAGDSVCRERPMRRGFVESRTGRVWKVASDGMRSNLVARRSLDVRPLLRRRIVLPTTQVKLWRRDSHSPVSTKRLMAASYPGSRLITSE